MNPPQKYIDSALANGPLGILASVLCLGAAVAVQRGEPIESVDIKDMAEENGLTLHERIALKSLLKECYEHLRHGTPKEIECAVALYKAQLKAAGWSVEEGYDH